MDPSPVSRLRRKEKVPRGRVRKFTPRYIPRDKYDFRLVIAAYAAMIAPVALVGWAWLMIPVWLVGLFGLSASVGSLILFTQWILWMWGAMRAVINHLEVADDGLRVAGFRSRTIPWSDVEGVEPLGRGDTLRAMLRWPFWEWNLQMSGGVTFGGYVRIRTKTGTLIFGPQNRAEFLDALHTQLYRKNPKVEIPVWHFHDVHNATTKTETEQVQRLRRG